MPASNLSTIERKLDLILAEMKIKDPLDLEPKTTAGAETSKPIASDVKKGGQDASAGSAPVVAPTPVVVTSPIVTPPVVVPPATPIMPPQVTASTPPVSAVSSGGPIAGTSPLPTTP